MLPSRVDVCRIRNRLVYIKRDDELPFSGNKVCAYRRYCCHNIETVCQTRKLAWLLDQNLTGITCF